MSAAEKLRAMVALPRGVEVCDEADLEENFQVTAADAHDAAVSAHVFIGAGLAGATAGGITLSVGDVQAVLWMLDLIKGRTAATVSAAAELALAQHEGVQ